MWIKKKTVFCVLALILSVVVAVICVSLNGKKDNQSPEINSKVVMQKLKNKTILIDAGHGGFDAGASGNGVEEKKINLEVALKLRDIISENGGKVIMTRETDCSTADENRKKGTSAKISDLQRRRAMVDESGANLFISIHMNKFEQSVYKGAQVFYAENSEASKMLGESIQHAFIRVMNDGNERVAKCSDGSIFILKKANVPSVVAECGFLSNPEEAANLQKEEYQKKIATAIYEGICEYIDKTENQK